MATVALAGCLLAAGCEQAPAVRTRPPPGPPIIPTGEGLVVGGIDACFGVPPKRNPGFVAGTVTVLRGKVKAVPVSSGITKVVLPTDRVASTRVSTHHRYRFDLPPGEYVLQARYSGFRSNIEPWVRINVAAGRLTHQDIPNECM